jgi:purine-binding chemotaxis protein CheW
VVEVLRVVAIRPVPHGPAWLAGVIDRRGQGLPIMDLRLRLGWPPQPLRLETRIIVAEVGEAGSACLLGLLVDEVLEVLTQEAAAIELPPALPGMEGAPLSTVQTSARLVAVFDVTRLSLEAQTLAEITPDAI